MNGKFGRIDPAVTLINRLRHSRTQSSAKKRAQYEASSALNGHNISISTLCPDKISGFQANNVKTRPMSAPSARRQSTGSLHSTNRNYKVTPEPSRECTEMKAESSRHNANSARCTRAVDVPVQVLRERGNALFQEQNYTDACTAYTRALELNPNFVMLYCNRAAAYLMLRKYHLALTDSVKVIELDPTNVKGHWRAGKAHLFMESYALARTFYLNARRSATNMQDVVAIDAEVKVIEWVELCRSKLNGKEWESALNLSNQILSVFPRNAPCNVPWECMHLEALIHLNQEKANQLLQNLFSTAPDFAEVWYLQAKWIFLTLTDTTSTEKALECLRKALNLGPTTCDSKVKHLMNAIESFQQLRDEGNSAYHSGNWNRAHSAYTRALEIDLGSAQLKSIILCNRAAVLMQSGKWLDSLEDINNAIRINPLHVKALVRRARIWQHFHRFQDAVKDLNDACVLSPTVENKAKLEHAKLLNHKSQTSNAKNFKESRYRYQSDKISVPNKIYYDIIGAPVNANMQSLTKHYRIAAFKWHPDKWIESDEQERERAETLFKKINHAYTFLKEHLQKSKSFADQ